MDGSSGSNIGGNIFIYIGKTVYYCKPSVF